MQSSTGSTKTTRTLPLPTLSQLELPSCLAVPTSLCPVPPLTLAETTSPLCLCPHVPAGPRVPALPMSPYASPPPQALQCSGSHHPAKIPPSLWDRRVFGLSDCCYKVIFKAFPEVSCRQEKHTVPFGDFNHIGVFNPP